MSENYNRKLISCIENIYSGRQYEICHWFDTIKSSCNQQQSIRLKKLGTTKTIRSNIHQRVCA